MKIILLQCLILASYFVLFRLFKLGDSYLGFNLWLIGLLLISIITIFLLPVLIRSGRYMRAVLSGSVLVISFALATSFNPVMMLGYSYDITDSSSNYPTLQDGEYIISRHFDFRINKGDMVGFNAPDGSVLRKRVAAKPDDKVLICDDWVFINDVRRYLVEQNRWESEPYSGGMFCNDIKEFTLGADKYFLLGDNQENSYDSRSFGPIDKASIFAKSLYKFSEQGHSNLSLPDSPNMK
jgi:signal peptidase I